jgi:hypothetical protein
VGTKIEVVWSVSFYNKVVQEKTIQLLFGMFLRCFLVKEGCRTIWIWHDFLGILLWDWWVL